MSPPRRLLAPEPGWTSFTDVVVVGSGVAGLTAALRIDALLARTAGPDGVRPSVTVVTKDDLSAGSTTWAQGGIAAALGPGDSPQEHLDDTLEAGAGLCDVAAVRALVTEGPDRVRELVALGTRFDQSPVGELLLTREGGHHRDRIAHAGGDATGREIQRALVAAVRAAPTIEVVEHALAVDLLLADGSGGVPAVAGVTLHVMGEGQRDGVGALHCRAVVLASGGLGQLFAATTNPPVATGDGTALAYRAGATIRDLEFVQFHPTVMWLGEDSRGQQPLISEAVRGEGAVLLDHEGRRVTEGVHPMGDLAPRDVVAKAINRRMRETGQPHVWLDATAFGARRWEERFPTILTSARSHGVDPVTDLIPVVPACHYASGGVATDLDGQTDVPGLFACGEVACSGVHGANRLASNSLLEGLVFGHRIASRLAADLPPRRTPGPDPRVAGLAHRDRLGEVQQTMTAYAGVLRSAAGLHRARADLAAMWDSGDAAPGTRHWETSNLVTVGQLLVDAALRREETRGSHWREDFPEADDASWCCHVDARAGADGPQQSLSPLGPTDEEVR
ncbi:L-aspartate oxidase [Nocardioidaceae bacterium]|nr:L-aspartate oxidase [Nocardioidaceae bacterium]